MASNYWIKLYHEIIDDPKMMKMSEVLFSRCIKLFLLAGDYGRDGELPPLEDAAWRLRIREEELESDLIELQRVGITTHQEGVWSISKWDERQGPMSSTERTRRSRSKKERDRKMREYKDRGPADVRFGGQDRAEDETELGRSVPQDTDKETDTEAETDREQQQELAAVLISEENCSKARAEEIERWALYGERIGRVESPAAWARAAARDNFTQPHWFDPKQLEGQARELYTGGEWSQYVEH